MFKFTDMNGIRTLVMSIINPNSLKFTPSKQIPGVFINDSCRKWIKVFLALKSIVKFKIKFTVEKVGTYNLKKKNILSNGYLHKKNCYILLKIPHFSKNIFQGFLVLF